MSSVNAAEAYPALVNVLQNGGWACTVLDRKSRVIEHSHVTQEHVLPSLPWPLSKIHPRLLVVTIYFDNLFENPSFAFQQSKIEQRFTYQPGELETAIRKFMEGVTSDMLIIYSDD
jgi:hypothetical protein